MRKKVIITLIQIVFLVCPILWLIFMVDYRGVLSALKSLDALLILFLFAVVFLRFVLQSVRFWILTTPFTQNLKLGSLILLDWKARYYSVIMPSSAGQDITRAVLLKKHLSVAEIVALTIFFRATGIITLIFLSLFGFFRLYAHETVPPASAIAVVILFLFICAAAIVSFSEKATQKMLSYLPEKTPKRITRFLENASKSMQIYKKYPKLSAFNLIFALFLHLLFLVFPLVAIYAVCGKWYVLEVLTFFPIIEIVAAAVPLLPNGAGVREVSVMLFFEYINATREQALSYITVSIILYLMLFFGFFAVLFDKVRKKIP